jgi:hypothetical protein
MARRGRFGASTNPFGTGVLDPNLASSTGSADPGNPYYTPPLPGSNEAHVPGWDPYTGEVTALPETPSNLLGGGATQDEIYQANPLPGWVQDPVTKRWGPKPVATSVAPSVAPAPPRATTTPQTPPGTIPVVTTIPKPNIPVVAAPAKPVPAAPIAMPGYVASWNGSSWVMKPVGR